MTVAVETGPSTAIAWRQIRQGVLLLGALLIFGVLAPAWAAVDEPMSFRLLTVVGKGGCPRDCEEVIAAEGQIDNDTADRFVGFLADHLQDHDLRPLVVLQSPGGTVLGAMQLGTVFRQIGAGVIVASTIAVGDGDQAVMVSGACLSACVYAFVGGARRVVPSISWLGIHRMVINERVFGPGGEATKEIFGSKDIVSALAAYTRKMGVDPRMIDYAERVAPEELHIVTARELARWRLARRLP